MKMQYDVSNGDECLPCEMWTRRPLVKMTHDLAGTVPRQQGCQTVLTLERYHLLPWALPWEMRRHHPLVHRPWCWT